MLRHHATRYDAVWHNAGKTHGFCSHIQRVPLYAKQHSFESSGNLVTSQVFTLRNIAEDGHYYLFALDKKSLAILRLTRLLNEGFR